MEQMEKSMPPAERTGRQGWGGGLVKDEARRKLA